MSALLAYLGSYSFWMRVHYDAIDVAVGCVGFLVMYGAVGFSAWATDRVRMAVGS